MFKMSIRRKVIIFFLIIMFVPSLLINLAMYRFSTDALVQQNVNKNLNTLSQIQEKMDALLQDAEYQLIAFTLDKEVSYLLSEIKSNTSIEFSPSQSEISFDQVYKSIKRTQTLNPNLMGVYIYLYEPHLVISSAETKKISLLRHSELFEWIQTPIRFERGNSGWNQIVTFASNPSTPSRVFVLKKSILSIGQAAFFIDERFINFNYISDNGNDSKIYIVNTNGVILSSAEDSMIGKEVDSILNRNNIFDKETGYANEQVNQEEMLVSYTTSQYTGWKYISMIPMKSVILDRTKVNRTMIVINMISMIIVALFVSLFSRNINQPIHELKNAIKDMGSGDLSIRLETDRTDEFQILYKGFNQMVTQIDRLINELYQEKLLHKEAQLKSLQEQFNPHFLYNSLDSIQWMVRLNQIEKVSSLIYSLSSFYKLRLNAGKKYTTIGETVLIIKDYLNIKKIRYDDNFKIDITVENGLEEFEILHLLILPIVENAIFHGIEKKSGANSIQISFFSENDNLVFQIIDNGMGMTVDKLEEVRKLLELNDEERQKAYMALNNIQKRVRLHYGKEYGLYIESKYNIGTLVRLVIPKNGNANRG